MGDWMSLLNGDPIPWLLEEGNPSARYLTLRDVLGKRGREVREAREAIMKSKLVERILSKQKRGGYWEDRDYWYKPKYKSTNWTLMILGQIGVDSSDKGVRRACEYAFQFQMENGCFGTWRSAMKPPFSQLCGGLTGNMVTALIRLEYENDPRIMKAVDWLIESQSHDGGWICTDWRSHKYDKHGCFIGSIEPLGAFSELPKRKWSARIRRASERAAEFFLMHRLFRADHHDFKIIKDRYLLLAFPRFYGYNILRALDVLTKLGYTKDERVQEALEILIDKQDEKGRFRLEVTPYGRMQTNLGQKGKTNKWVTLQALGLLRRVYQ